MLSFKGSTLSLTFLPLPLRSNLSFFCVDHWWIYQALSQAVAKSKSMRSYSLLWISWVECSSGRPPAQSYSQEVWSCRMALGTGRKLLCFKLFEGFCATWTLVWLGMVTHKIRRIMQNFEKNRLYVQSFSFRLVWLPFPYLTAQHWNLSLAQL